ncbi:alpha/beta hydrolase [Acinetobacter soli]|uniref:alpha/beta hydrolase n=1 Tax=Acinetobacter soli TaxID=487316 RepID=UPI00124FDE44|nr:alpha/beta hydrolase [Acinetobacter soli]
MLNKPHQLLEQLGKQVEWVKEQCKSVRVYDLGSYALNRLTPKSSYSCTENIAYGLKARQRLDLYRVNKPLAHRPLVVFVHGGAWQHGDKKDYVFLGESLTREGYDVAIINYHLAPQSIFPVFVDDLAVALQYLDQHQARLNISTQQIILMGHSSGAFNIMSLVYHPQRLALQCYEQIKAIVGFAGPYYFDYKGDPLAEDAFDQSVPYQQVMPYYFVKKNHIRHYMFLAENDHIVKQSNSLDMQQVLVQAGNHSHVSVIPKTGHITIIATLSSLFSRYFKTKRTLLNLLKETHPVE